MASGVRLGVGLACALILVAFTATPAPASPSDDVQMASAVHPMVASDRVLLSSHLAPLGPVTVSRDGGADRYETAVEVSRASHPSGAAIVYLAVGTDYPDAIAAGPAAAFEGAPILLSRPTSLPAATRDELRRLDPGRVVVLGGTSAVTDTVLAQIAHAVPGATVERRWGHDRYATAAALSRAAFPAGIDTVFVATGRGFTDAATAAPWAVARRSPLLLVPDHTVPAPVVEELARLHPRRIVIVGSVAAVPAIVEGQLAAIAPVTRVGAADPYQSAATVSRASHPGGSATVYVAVGDRFPDALAAGPLTAATGGPLLLVRSDSVPTTVADELTRLRASHVVVLGGASAVSDRVATWLGTGSYAGGLPSPEVIYLTFDDGPHPTRTYVILDILDRYGVKATFFHTGYKAAQYPQVERDILARGHSLQTHGWDHPDMTGWSYSSVSSQITRGVDAIVAATGTHPSCFRPPYGAMSSTIRRAAADQGLEIVMWTVDTGDSLHQTTSGILRSSWGWDPGDIVLGHDTLSYLWDDILPGIIEYQLSLGRTFETLCSND